MGQNATMFGAKTPVPFYSIKQQTRTHRKTTIAVLHGGQASRKICRRKGTERGGGDVKRTKVFKEYKSGFRSDAFVQDVSWPGGPAGVKEPREICCACSVEGGSRLQECNLVPTSCATARWPDSIYRIHLSPSNDLRR